MVDFLSAYPFQPATALWRAIEVAEVLAAGGLPPGRGLDLGCGDGLLTEILLRRTGPRVLVGVDNDRAEVEIAREVGIYEELYATGAESLAGTDERFDFVFSNSVLEHVDDIDALLARTAELLVEGGVLLFNVPANGFHDCLRGPILRPRTRSAYLRRLDRRLYHLRYWGEAEWTAELARHGLRLVSARPYMGRRRVRRWEAVSGLTAGLLYTVLGRRERPIEIQRRLGLRSRRRRLPRWPATALARVLGAGLRPADGGPFGCLLVRAIKEG